MPAPILINVSFTTSTLMSQRFLRIASEIREPTVSRLTRGKIPHMTLYMARVSSGKVDLVQERLATYVASRSWDFVLAPLKYNVTAGSYVEILYSSSKYLNDVQDTIIHLLSPVRWRPTNYAKYYEQYFGPYSKEQQANVRSVGYDLAGKLFRPHVTLARFKDASPNSVDIQDELPTFVPSFLSVFEADELGASKQLIEQWALDRGVVEDKDVPDNVLSST